MQLSKQFMLGSAQQTISNHGDYSSLDTNHLNLQNSQYFPLYKYLLSQKINPARIQKIEETRKFVDWFWGKLIVHPDKFTKRDAELGAIKLPASYIMPMSKGGLHSRFFYWDSWFTSIPHIGTNREYVAIGAVENCAYLFKKFNVIPNQADIRFLHRSQPPVYTSMIMDVYESFSKRAGGNSELIKEYKDWLNKYIKIAENEYRIVWTNATISVDDEKDSYNHRKYTFTTLSNWGDRDIGYHFTSELESGKDTTAEFAGRAGDFLPLDLNCFLLKYERDFAKAASILGKKSEKKYWIDKAKERIQEINKYMWDEETGYFYNYDVKNNKKDNFKTLSGYQTLWTGLASKKQALRMMQNLHFFESDHGLMTTSPESTPPDFSQIDKNKLLESGIPERYLETIKNMLLPGQWTAPNIWSPTQLMAIFGFVKYGFYSEAKRIMQNSIISLSEYFDNFRAMPEKRNGFTGKNGGNHTYADKSGFGWTNAEFIILLNLLQKLVINSDDASLDQEFALNNESKDYYDLPLAD